MVQNPDEIINVLKMTPHPEGGHFKELYRDKNVSVIFYLLKKNENSHWHKLSKNEILHFYKGFPLLVHLYKDGEKINTKILGNNLNNNEDLNIIIKANTWFSMKSSGEYSLIGCTVSPPFEYSDFELAPPDWAPIK